MKVEEIIVGAVHNIVGGVTQVHLVQKRVLLVGLQNAVADVHLFRLLYAFEGRMCVVLDVCDRNDVWPQLDPENTVP